MLPDVVKLVFCVVGVTSVAKGTVGQEVKLEPTLQAATATSTPPAGPTTVKSGGANPSLCQTPTSDRSNFADEQSVNWSKVPLIGPLPRSGLFTFRPKGPGY